MNRAKVKKPLQPMAAKKLLEPVPVVVPPPVRQRGVNVRFSALQHIPKHVQQMVETYKAAVAERTAKGRTARTK
jgi:hypothetical protein